MRHRREELAMVHAGAVHAQRLAQLKAGNVHFFPDIRAEDVIGLHRDEPRVLLYETEFLPTTQVWTFGHLPIGVPYLRVCLQAPREDTKVR